MFSKETFVHYFTEPDQKAGLRAYVTLLRFDNTFDSMGFIVVVNQ